MRQCSPCDNYANADDDDAAAVGVGRLITLDWRL
jgi:hypothetical protein